MTTIGNRLHQSRRDLNIKLSALAAQIGVTPSYLSKIETGRATNLSIDLIASLASALDVRPEYLAGWSDDATGEDRPASITEGRVVYEVDSPLQYHRIQQLLDLYNSLDSNRQDLAITIIQELHRAQTPRIIE